MAQVGTVLFGQTLPMIAAVVAFPFLFDGLGPQRFGYFMLAWTVAGYASLFDLGFGRALTKMVASHPGSDFSNLTSLFWFTQVSLLVLPGIICVGIILLAPSISALIGSDAEIQNEVTSAFRVLATSIPFITAASALRGTIEGFQRFDVLAAVRIPTGAASAGLPLLVLSYTDNLVALTAALVIVRLITYIALLIANLWIQPSFRKVSFRHLTGLSDLISFGSWVSVSNLVGPIMVTMDRFLLGAVAGIAAVSYYVTPFEAHFRVLVLVTSLTTVLFPLMAARHRTNEAHGQNLLLASNRITFSLLFPITTSLVALGPEVLAAWMGSEFASGATAVWRWLAVGVFFNGLAQTPFAYLHAIGRPRATGVLHLLELLPYLIVLYLLAMGYGPVGAAIAWTARAGMDYLALAILTKRSISSGGGWEVGSTIVAVICFSLVSIESTLVVRVAAICLIYALFFPLAWRWVLTAPQREQIRQRLSWSNGL